ncbi:unnamed protein product [Cyprideis torosa]|uniref:Uncharacterized protein n=1 Tax=Cyprideis torosa TaxID=163714 RepID=A0A7R8ZFY3_9CRUS|nr:unnamed protein product [Cyprideis torosa]CAG0880229.1 unnamed protein product [Cyprideis torosa]
MRRHVALGAAVAAGVAVCAGVIYVAQSGNGIFGSPKLHHGPNGRNRPRKKSGSKAASGDEGEAVEDSPLAVQEEKVVERRLVPQSLIGPLNGKDSANLKRIMRKSGALMVFQRDVSDPSSVSLILEGTQEQIIKANNLINDFIAQLPTIRHGVFAVSARQACLLEGFDFTSLEDTTETSISVAPGSTALQSSLLFRISGSSVGVKTAKSLLSKEVARREQEDDKKREAAGQDGKVQASLGAVADKPFNLSPRNTSAACAPVRPVYAEFPSSSPDSYETVQVSCVISPLFFYVQALGQDNHALLKLENEMQEFYGIGGPGRNWTLDLSDLSPGQLVASYTSFDERIYRAIITNLELLLDAADEDGYVDPTNTSVDVFFPDYGDSSTVKLECVFPLRKDWCFLPLQAVPVSLLNAKPRGSHWTEEEVVEFASIVHEAQAVPVLAKKMGTISMAPPFDESPIKDPVSTTLVKILLDPNGNPDSDLLTKMNTT